MRFALVVTVTLTVLLTGGYGALAIVTTGTIGASEARDAVVFGTFGGYKSGLIYLVQPDGVRIAYTFEPRRELLKHLSRYRLNQQLRLFLRDAQVVRVEEMR